MYLCPNYISIYFAVKYLYLNISFYNYIYTFTQTDVEGDWISHDKLKITVKFWRYVNKYYYDIYNFTTGASAPWGPNEIIQFPQFIRVYKTFDYNELLNDTIIY